MARLGARYQHFFAKGKIYKHFWMGTEALNAAASGVTLTASASLIADTASGSAQVSGTTLDAVAASIIAGDAAGSAHANGHALGIGITLIPGVASAENSPVRMAGGSAFVRAPNVALGAVVTTSVSIIPGTVQIGHEVTLKHADGSSEIVTIFGATDEELRDPEFILAVVTDDWDPYILKQHREAA